MDGPLSFKQVNYLRKRHNLALLLEQQWLEGLKGLKFQSLKKFEVEKNKIWGGRVRERAYLGIGF